MEFMHMREHRPVSKGGVRTALLLAISLAWFGAMANNAMAGVYPMYQCRDALGHASSVNARWSIAAVPGGQLYNFCSSRGDFGIRQTPAGQTGNESGTRLALTVPESMPHVSFNRIELRVLIAPKTGDPVLSHGGVTLSSGGQEIDTQSLPTGSTTWINRVDAPLGGSAPTGSRDATLSVYCFASCLFAPMESAEIQQAVISLVEADPPLVTRASGSMLEPGPRAGTETLTYDASDADSGIRATTVLVDGASVAVDDLSGFCHYDDFAPCPTDASNRFLTIDTRRLFAGAHRLVLRAEDAAGNVAIKDVGSFVVAEGAAPRLVPTARLNARYAVTLKPSRTLRWGQRFRTRGRLTALDGRALSGVPVVATVLGSRGRVTRTIGQAKTRRDGSWAMRLRARFPSGRVGFTYADGRGGGATATLRAKVRAGVRLTAKRHVVAPFGRIRVGGRLLGGPVPRRGKVVEMQARGQREKRWITFKTVRTDRRGRFTATHKLKQGYRNVTYEFRAVSRFDAGYPYETGASAVERVAVR
jgi:hypothetical protein